MVTECAVKPRRRCPQSDSELDADSSADDLEAIIMGPGKVVDTDDEASAGSLGSSSSGDDPFLDSYIIAKPLKAATGAPATGGEPTTGGDAVATSTKSRRAGFEPLWSDPYFTVWGHPNVEFVRCLVREQWRQPPGGMGRSAMTKTLTPRHYEEDCSDPVRSLLLLRGWALWRARQDGWATAQRGRARHFQEQATLLECDVKALGCRCKLLGHRKANSMLRSWVPDIIERLLA